MHITHLEAIALVQKLAFSLDRTDHARVDVSIHPAFTALRSVQTILDADDIPIALGAQNVYWEPSGPFTGEISPLMLAKLNVKYVIVGHSERRQHFGETDDMVNKKVKAVFAAGMTPIMCVGETIEEREAGESEAKVVRQLQAGTEGLGPEAVSGLVVAYEPIWAIGTGRTATPDDAQTVCAEIRAAVAAVHGPDVAGSIRIQYGGSVRATNMAELMAERDIDGALVGGASLDPTEFAQIITYGRN
jgi:triosephosphate isomerase (TIM)